MGVLTRISARRQVRSIADVTLAVANGDLSRKIEVEVKGEMLDLKVRLSFSFLPLPAPCSSPPRQQITINNMVDSLKLFAAEVTRVAKEVGTDGQLGGQAYVLNVSGEWKSLVESVNVMCRNLTDQVRSIAKATVRFLPSFVSFPSEPALMSLPSTSFRRPPSPRETCRRRS